MQSFIVAALTDYRDKVQAVILKADPDATFENVPNLCTFWVSTKLSRWSIECITGVCQVHLSIRDAKKIQQEAAKQRN